MLVDPEATIYFEVADLSSLTETSAIQSFPMGNAWNSDVRDGIYEIDALNDQIHHQRALSEGLQQLFSQRRYAFGDAPGLADCCLIPQVANSRRFDTPLDAFPTIRRIEQACLALDAFAKAAPQLQPDAV